MKIYIGDITKISDSDVIVNAADTNFTPGGGIARWIAKEGGQEIFKEAQKYTPGEVGKVYPTNAGKLKVKKVFHIPTIDWKKNRRIKIPEIHTICIIAIEEALKQKMKSIVFPLLGAGTLGLDEKKVANEISEAIIHMEKENPKFTGAICILNKQTYNKIKEALPNKIKMVNLEK